MITNVKATDKDNAVVRTFKNMMEWFFDHNDF